jgi:hypothetical protein
MASIQVLLVLGHHLLLLQVAVDAVGMLVQEVMVGPVEVAAAVRTPLEEQEQLDKVMQVEMHPVLTTQEVVAVAQVQRPPPPQVALAV